MSKKKHDSLKVEAKNYYCVYCLAFEDEWVEADYLFFNEDEEKVMPLCADHRAMLEEEKHFFVAFSVN